MYRLLKRVIYRGARALGLFRLAWLLTGRGLRILGYHALSRDDEHHYAPDVFMAQATFRRRLALLKRWRVTVLGLGDALARLDAGTLPRGATVVTFDDGWATTAEAVRLLRSDAMPATVYVTTQEALSAEPVFRHVVRYLLQRTKTETLTLEGLLDDGRTTASIRTTEEQQVLAEQLIARWEPERDPAGLEAIARTLAARLGDSYDRIVTSGLLTMLGAEGVRTLAHEGTDIQLHTHRHHFPVGALEALSELRENREHLEPLTSATTEHFCYPCGRWSPEHWRPLHEAGVKTAVTSDPGFNYRATPRLALKRFLDSECISDIEFEAEISGFQELLRRARGAVSRAVRRSSATAAAVGGHPAVEPLLLVAATLEA